MQPHQAGGDAEVSRKPWPPSGKVEPVSADSASLATPAKSVAPSAVPVSSADEMALAMLALLNELDVSLRGSQKAVLASDGLSLENSTREQFRLHRTLEMLLWPRSWPGTAAENDVQKGARRNALPFRPKFVSQCAPHLAAELLAAEGRVLQATRVQAALLSRVRQFQRILANVAAAHGAPCGAWFGQSSLGRTVQL